MSEACGGQLCDFSVSNDVSGVESLLSRSDKSSFINYKDDEVIYVYNRNKLNLICCAYVTGRVDCASFCCCKWSFRNSDTIN
jgi:hypothetical protein